MRSWRCSARTAAGKSTAVSLMLGLRRAGCRTSVLLHGLDPRDPEARRSVGVVLQNVGFPDVAPRPRDRGASCGRTIPDAPPTDGVLERLGLAELSERVALGLSGGQQRRLAVALALSGNTDERCSWTSQPPAWTPPDAGRCSTDVAAFAAEGGAVLLTTQQLAEAEDVASRVVLLVRGRILLEGTVPEVRAHAGLAKVTVRADELPSTAGRRVRRVEARPARDLRRGRGRVRRSSRSLGRAVPRARGNAGQSGGRVRHAHAGARRMRLVLAYAKADDDRVRPVYALLDSDARVPGRA